MKSGLHYNRHRHYDSSLGRYFQPDPLGLVDGPSLYAYVGNDPLGDADLDGLNRGRGRSPCRRSFFTPPGVKPNALSYPPRTSRIVCEPNPSDR
ncbi:MAG: RHS repeat-associated core domain-containing protein [Hyphomicrobium sp.]|nr:RHS repeat-associated core domain-containing protein [Hyphomicrobium sp.]